jgi:hypothetical protein
LLPTSRPLAIIERSAEGTIVGRYLLDADLALFRLRVDTTLLTGEARLRYPDGRIFRTPASFARTMRIEMLDEATRTARDHRRDSAHAGFSILIRPEGTGESLARGDKKVLEALLDTIARSGNADARRRAYGFLRMWARDSSTARRVRAATVAAGDTESVLRELSDEWGTRGHQIDANDLALVLPVMSDPGAAFAFGLERDWLYVAARDDFLTHPPAITRDTTQWPCTPEACRMLAAQWTSDADSRLRDVGLVAHLALDPKQWSDTVMARSAAGDHFLDGAAALIRGVATLWAAGAKAPLPTPGAGWRAWSNWMDGRAPSSKSMGPGQVVRFENSHVVAIRFAAVRTGRDFAAEWRQSMQHASDDTARMVFGEMLVGLGESPDDPAIVARNLRSASPLLRGLASREVVGLFSHGATAADEATATDVQDRLLAVAVDGEQPWPVIDSTMNRGLAQTMPRKITEAVDHAYGPPYPAPGPLVVLGDSLATRVRSKWAQRGIRMVERAWDPSSNESAIELDLSGVRTAGPFARIRVTQTHLTARINGRGQSWAAGATLYLMRSGAGWVIVAAESWIT